MNEFEPGMSLIVKTITRLVVGFLLLYGIYVVLQGHIALGGGFAGGVIIALSFIQLMLAFGKEVALKKLSQARAFVIESLGVIAFLLITVAGFAGGYFFSNFFVNKGRPFELFSAGIIPLCNIAISLIVGAGLFVIILALVLFRHLEK